MSDVKARGLTVADLVSDLVQTIVSEYGEVPPDDVISAFHIAVAQIGCAFDKDVGELTASQQLVYYKVRDSMRAEGSYGCAVTAGNLSMLIRN